jgi:hypothetical protein
LSQASEQIKIYIEGALDDTTIKIMQKECLKCVESPNLTSADYIVDMTVLPPTYDWVVTIYDKDGIELARVKSEKSLKTAIFITGAKINELSEVKKALPPERRKIPQSKVLRQTI